MLMDATNIRPFIRLENKASLNPLQQMGNQKNDNQINDNSGNPDDPNKNLAQNNTNDFGDDEPLASQLPFDAVNKL